jgi:hypothetical protein
MKVPGIGEVKTQYVIATGAVGVGIVGYAWWKKSTNAATPDPITAGEAQGIGDGTVLPAGFTGNATGAINLNDPTQITTNAQWTKQAVSDLADKGFDTLAVSSALGKFLSRQPVTAAEAELIRDAIAFEGNPPENGPWPIIPTPVVVTPPPAPTGYVGPAKVKPTSVWGVTHGFKPNATNFEQVLLGHYVNYAPPGSRRFEQVRELATANGYPYDRGVYRYDKKRLIRLPATLA